MHLTFSLHGTAELDLEKPASLPLASFLAQLHAGESIGCVPALPRNKAQCGRLSLCVVTVDMHEARTHLSRLVDRAAGGEPVVIARAGKPMVKVVPVDVPDTPKRIGFLAGIEIPDDFDRMAEKEISPLFGVKE